MPQVRKVASLRRLFHFLLRARFQTDSHGRGATTAAASYSSRRHRRRRRAGRASQRDDGGGGDGVLLVGGWQVQLTRRAAVGRALASSARPRIVSARSGSLAPRAHWRLATVLLACMLLKF